MAWKINKITIENFKFFLNPFELKPEGKHVLMYGENGSGKSSIYWAVNDNAKVYQLIIQ